MIAIREVINFIKTIRRLIAEGRYEFVPRDYSGKDYIVVLLEDFMITPEEAVDHLKTLTPHMWKIDDKPNYFGTGCYIFKKQINGAKAYIKLKVENDVDGDILVIISFHKDH